MEAAMAARVTDVFTPSFSFGDRWVVEPVDGKSLILVVTASCTTSLLVAPLFVAAVWALLLRRLRQHQRVPAPMRREHDAEEAGERDEGPVRRLLQGDARVLAGPLDGAGKEDRIGHDGSPTWRR
jgi:hypothetical protein